ncbi:hypothetical protein DBR40_09170 [Pedobacter sp. KBW01]|uniref:DUF6808 domain-containing protein n=1 Tax=Pedobacter sp. KBW01 TaxID=2153364 RepID=UPI000F5AC590|nr:hypothetical protein [Pedobacter sp. KBW01]RQO78110.1 hypothetical protein DBR40_09170 [Pedobacter sp. KBW01]
MKNTILKLCLAVMVVLCGWLTYKLVFGKPESRVTAKPSNDIINEAKTEAQIIAKSVDNQGYSKTVAKRKGDILSNGDISKLPISQSVMDSLRLDNLDKSSKLQQASAMIGKLEAKNLRAVAVIDSLHRKSYQYKDDFLTASFTPDSAGGTFDAISWKLKLIRHDYKKRKNFISPYTYYTDILSPDKRVSIGELQNLSIESHRPTRWGIGLQAGYYYTPSENKFLPALGLGVSYNIIRF